MRGSIRWLLAVPHNRALVKLILAVNLFGTGYGFYWYRGQLASVQPAVWPVVPDSPLATLYFALLLAAILSGRGTAAIGSLAYAAGFKYGLWTPAVMSYFWVEAQTMTFESVHLTLSHLGMALEAAIFQRVYRPHPGWTLAAGAWLLFNDLVDYGLGLHPTLPMSGQEGFAAAAAFLLTPAAVLLTLSARPRQAD